MHSKTRLQRTLISLLLGITLWSVGAFQAPYRSHELETLHSRIHFRSYTHESHLQISSTSIHRVGLLGLVRPTKYRRLNGWLDNFLPPKEDVEYDTKRKQQYPEQYPATYELLKDPLPSDENDEEKI